MSSFYKIAHDLTDVPGTITTNTDIPPIYLHYTDPIYVDSIDYPITRTTEEILDELDLEEIETYIRKKKLHKLQKKLK